MIREVPNQGRRFSEDLASCRRVILRKIPDLATQKHLALPDFLNGARGGIERDPEFLGGREDDHAGAVFKDAAKYPGIAPPGNGGGRLEWWGWRGDEGSEQEWDEHPSRIEAVSRVGTIWYDLVMNSGLVGSGAVSVNTGNVRDRRVLRFDSSPALMVEVERLVASEQQGKLRMSGNWTLGQNRGHLAAWVKFGFEGTPLQPPWIVKGVLRLMKNRLLNKGLPTGARIPTGGKWDTCNR